MASPSGQFSKTLPSGFHTSCNDWVKRPYIGGPSLHATLTLHPARIPPTSVACSKHALAKELKWNNRFAVAYSKDNPNYHAGLREYFGCPRKFDTETESVFRRSTTKLKAPLEKSKLLPSFSLKRRKLIRSPDKKELRKQQHWTHVYTAISENNVVKHASQRHYFMPVRGPGN